MAFDIGFFGAYYSNTATVTTGSTGVIIPADNYQPGMITDNWQIDFGQPYVRLLVSTQSAFTTTVAGGTFSMFIPGLTPDYPYEQNFILNGLTSGSTYYWKIQKSADNTTWSDGQNIGTTTPSFTLGTSAATITADFTANTTTGPASLAVTLTDISTGTPFQWLWSVSNGTASQTQTYQTPTFYLQTGGTYTVTLTATNADGSDSEVKTNYITVISALPVPSWTQNTTTGVRPLTVTYTGTATSNNTSYTPSSWGWALPTGIGTQNPATRTAVVTYNVAGIYPATFTATHWIGSGSTSSASAVYVKPIGVGATFTASPLSGPIPLSVQFLATPSGDSTGVLWNFGDSVTTTELNPSHVYYSTGSFSPTLTVYATTATPLADTLTATATATNLITAEASWTYKELMEDLRRQLLLNTDVGTVCTDFESWGGASSVLKHIYNRICRLNLETGILKKTYTTITGTAGLLDLPSDLIEIRSIYVNGVRLEKCDPRMADLYDANWVSATSGDYVGWYTNPGEHLKLQLVPPVNPSTFEVYYTYAPTVPTVPGDCATANWAALPFPYVYWWVIKYGVLSDLLQQEGDMYDIERAQLCEQLWNEGIQMIKLTTDGK